MASASSVKLAIIGAGVTGLSCARVLIDHGLSPKVFEKSRGFGGRVATRRVSEDITFDHGAQFATTLSTDSDGFFQRALGAGDGAVWTPKISGVTPPDEERWVVGLPGMSGLVKQLTARLAPRFLTRIMGIERADAGWRVRSSFDPAGEVFDRLVCTVPAPQAQAFFATEPEIAERLAPVKMAPCWTLLVVFGQRFEPGFDVWRGDEAGLDWIARNTSKPERPTEKDCWVIHASAAWSQDHLELDPEVIGTKMLDLLKAEIGSPLPDIEYITAHRWRYAHTTVPLGAPYFCTEDHTLLIGGDWCLGMRIEDAMASGTAMGKALSETFAS